MKTGGFVAIGFNLGEDLSTLIHRPGALRNLVSDIYPDRDLDYIETFRQFVMGIGKGDVVLAADGSRVLGIGRVTGDYQYDDRGDGAPPYRRNVQWLNLNVWQAPVWPGRAFPEGYRRTLYQLQHPTTLRAIRERVPQLESAA